MTEAPDNREQEDCPGADVCGGLCDQHAQCPQTKFPDGTRCGEYGWHAANCPMKMAPTIAECNCESMGGRFGAHRPECPWQIAFEQQVKQEEDEHESYQDRRVRLGDEAEKHHKSKLDPKHEETEAEYKEVLNRDDEVLDGDASWNTVWHEVVVRFRWSEINRYTESAMESIEMVDADPIGSAIDAHLEPHYDTDTSEVISKTHRVEYEND